METKQIYKEDLSVFTNSFTNIEIADDYTRAILIIPLMHVGANKKNLFWTAKMLKKIAPLFRGVPYRYDITGSEGSSHAVNKLSSPYFDVGWSYSSEEGAWYDSKTKSLWTKGEVTHPDVISKLSRTTSDGKREVNYASMGVYVEKAICSICGAEMEGNVCENDHVRGEKYDNKTCYKVPTEVSKALHIALTNDPADGESEIKNVLFQELGGYQMNDKKNLKSNVQDKNFQKKGTDKSNDDNTNIAPNENRAQEGQQQEQSELSNQIPGGLASSSPQTEQPGSAPSAETILRDLAERIKTIEGKLGNQVMQEGSPEVVNAAPQDQLVQDNMGTTSQFDDKEEKTMKAEEKVPAASPREEVQEMNTDPMSQVMEMLKQILERLPSTEVQDMGKESLEANKGQAQKAQEDIPLEHQGEGAVNSTDSEGNVKNKENMMKPSSVATADNAELVKKEFADLKAEVKSLRSKLELQDNNVPEFGGSNNTGSVDVADMSASDRQKKFGDFGKWDSCFNGAGSAQKFVRDM